MVNNNGLTCPRGALYYFPFCAGKEEKQNRHDLLGTNSQRGLVLPPELSQIPPPASLRRGGRLTHYLPLAGPLAVAVTSPRAVAPAWGKVAGQSAVAAR